MKTGILFFCLYHFAFGSFFEPSPRSPDWRWEYDRYPDIISSPDREINCENLEGRYLVKFNALAKSGEIETFNFNMIFSQKAELVQYETKWQGQYYVRMTSEDKRLLYSSFGYFFTSYYEANCNLQKSLCEQRLKEWTRPKIEAVEKGLIGSTYDQAIFGCFKNKVDLFLRGL